MARGSIADYDKQRSGINAGVNMFHGNQPGDPHKAAERIADVVRLEGTAKGRTEWPSRLPLGGDGVDWIQKKCEKTLKDIEEWGDIIRETDRDGVDQSAQYDPRDGS
jgi:hypothetical protein